jgi:3-deoxy-manno-octulosonate cytidylyltransferase (CMP-KDO synthetase)
MNTIGIIPARYASTRFPGKPLVNIAGKSMIQRVYEQALKSEMLQAVVVATDDERIANNVKSFGGEVVITSQHHLSGTDRCFEALKIINQAFEAIVNIQGDEPYIHPGQIDKIVKMLLRPEVQLTTLCKKIELYDELNDPNCVKVVLDNQSRALYFSRYPIPYVREQQQIALLEHASFFKHIGIYGYKAKTLAQITQLPPSYLEKNEELEQLRWLENGYSIFVDITDADSFSVDRPDDLQKLINNG